MNKSTQYNQQTEPKQYKPGVEEICIYIPKPGKWLSQHLYLKINSGFHARKNPYQQCLKIVTSRSVMLHSAKSAIMLQLCSLDNTEQTISSARESFNIIRQKQGLFILGVVHILNLQRVCTKLTHDTWNIPFDASNSFKKFEAIASTSHTLYPCFRLLL